MSEFGSLNLDEMGDPSMSEFGCLYLEHGNREHRAGRCDCFPCRECEGDCTSYDNLELEYPVDRAILCLAHALEEEGGFGVEHMAARLVEFVEEHRNRYRQYQRDMEVD